MEAQKAFALIENFATTTPFQLEEIVQAFIRLKALGLDPSQDALTSYGNTASAFGKNIVDFTDAISSAVMGNFRQLKEYGIMAQSEGDKVPFLYFLLAYFLLVRYSLKSYQNFSFS
ncbi:MAG: hypothetical protein PHX68_01375 [Alphaproteobacteria bacterium]|nr:hypothetical protein [Alphaproteobacteria bacterium]